MLTKAVRVAVLVFVASTSLVGGQSTSLRDYPAFFPADALASPRIAALRKAVGAGDPRALQEFWDEVHTRGAPLVEPGPDAPPYSLVTFVWRGTVSTRNVVVVDGVAAAVGGVDPRSSEMIHLEGADVWYRTYKVRNDARFVYRLSENDPLQSPDDPNRRSASTADPLNPHVFAAGQSYVELSEAPSQEAALRPSNAPGKLDDLKFRSPSLANERDVWVYTPHDFSPNGGPYPLLVVFDGSAHTTRVPVPTILDNLIQQGRIPPTVAAMVGSLNRDAELSCSPGFAAFVAAELVPWMRTNYRATTSPAMTVVAGSSLGGLAAAFTGFQHPTVFGKVLSQSGSYWWAPDDAAQGEWLTRQLAHSSQLPLEFFMEVGQMEIPDQRDTNQHLRDVLREKGYVVHYQEFNGNHTDLDWRGSFADGLVALLGISATAR